MKKVLWELDYIDKVQNSKDSVYMLRCECNDMYIGETGRPVDIRIDEHRSNVKRKKAFTSLVAEHALNNGHRFQWDSTVTLYKESNSRKRKFIEAGFIACCDNVISQSSTHFDDSWRSLLTPVFKDIFCHNN